MIAVADRATRADLFYSLRWSLSAAAVAASYIVAVRYGGAPVRPLLLDQLEFLALTLSCLQDVVGRFSDQLTRNFLGH